tara:strand:- start:1061 stop:1198 length:138 start_codon:yes stop_codon:yes gene_type:complete
VDPEVGGSTPPNRTIPVICANDHPAQFGDAKTQAIDAIAAADIFI